jgi:hypothetical protein
VWSAAVVAPAHRRAAPRPSAGAVVVTAAGVRRGRVEGMDSAVQGGPDRPVVAR